MCTLVRCSYHAKRFNEWREFKGTSEEYLIFLLNRSDQEKKDNEWKKCNSNEGCIMTECDTPIKIDELKGRFSNYEHSNLVKKKECLHKLEVLEDDWRTYTINCADSPYLWRK